MIRKGKITEAIRSPIEKAEEKACDPVFHFIYKVDLNFGVFVLHLIFAAKSLWRTPSSPRETASRSS